MTIPPDIDELRVRPRRAVRLVHTDIEQTDESMVFDPTTDKVTVLNAVAGAVWLLCDGTRDVEAICDIIAEHWAASDVARDRVVCDVRKVLLEFEREGLLES